MGATASSSEASASGDLVCGCCGAIVASSLTNWECLTCRLVCRSWNAFLLANPTTIWSGRKVDIYMSDPQVASKVQAAAHYLRASTDLTLHETTRFGRIWASVLSCFPNLKRVSISPFAYRWESPTQFNEIFSDATVDREEAIGALAAMSSQPSLLDLDVGFYSGVIEEVMGPLIGAMSSGITSLTVGAELMDLFECQRLPKLHTLSLDSGLAYELRMLLRSNMPNIRELYCYDLKVQALPDLWPILGIPSLRKFVATLRIPSNNSLTVKGRKRHVIPNSVDKSHLQEIVITSGSNIKGWLGFCSLLLSFCPSVSTFVCNTKFNSLPTMPNSLKVVDFSDSNASDVDVTRIATACNQLASIKLTNCKRVTAKGIQVLISHCTLIKCMHLSGTSLQAQDLPCLTHVDDLQELQLSLSQLWFAPQTHPELACTLPSLGSLFLVEAINHPPTMKVMCINLPGLNTLKVTFSAENTGPSHECVMEIVSQLKFCPTSLCIENAVITSGLVSQLKDLFPEVILSFPHPTMLNIESSAPLTTINSTTISCSIPVCLSLSLIGDSRYFLLTTVVDWNGHLFHAALTEGLDNPVQNTFPSQEWWEWLYPHLKFKADVSQQLSPEELQNLARPLGKEVLMRKHKTTSLGSSTVYFFKYPTSVMIDRGSTNSTRSVPQLPPCEVFPLYFSSTESLLVPVVPRASRLWEILKNVTVILPTGKKSSP
ncbi:hypothetical protein Pelo_16298 [Pelomyxa schiedti]|nr:hypothetical protein Pelo_16298 [Pelomyxa schiedti]